MSLTVLETPLTVLETLDSIDEARKELNEWDCGPMTISVAESLADGTMKSINFTDTLGHRKHVPPSDKRSDDNCYWLNPEWKENTKTFRTEVSYPYFVLWHTMPASKSVVVGREELPALFPSASDPGETIRTPT